MKKTFIRLPIDESDNIYWKYMEDYIKQLPLGEYLN